MVDDPGNGCDATSSSLYTINVVDDPIADPILSTQTVCEQTPISSATELEILNPTLGINSIYDYEWFDITGGTPGTSVGVGSTFTPPTSPAPLLLRLSMSSETAPEVRALL